MPGSTVITKPGSSGARQAQALEAELRALRLALVAHPDLAEVLHVVHVEAHHVAEAALEEHGVRALRHRLVEVALHQAEPLEALGERAAGQQVDLAERTPGFTAATAARCASSTTW